MKKTNTIAERGEGMKFWIYRIRSSSIVRDLSVCRLLVLNFKNQPIRFSAHHFGSVSERSSIIILHREVHRLSTTTYYTAIKMNDTNTFNFLLGSITILLAISSLLTTLLRSHFGSSSTSQHELAGNVWLLYSIFGLAIIFQYHLLSDVSMRHANVPRDSMAS